MAFTSPQESVTSFLAAFNTGDRAALLDFYEPGAMLIAEPGQSVTGHEAIGAVIDGFLGTGGKLTMTSSYCYVNGDMALTGAAWSLAGKDADGKPVDLGGANTAEVMRRQPDGSWRYILDTAVAG
ncbi:MAG: nuclear transport factor 2 family protein [Chloroflexi bacterium]|nr:nuclear transport factor 2 family protein [Chloroflexota bacterium]